MSWKYEAWKNGNFVVLDVWLKEIHIFSWLLHKKLGIVVEKIKYVKKEIRWGKQTRTDG